MVILYELHFGKSFQKLRFPFQVFMSAIQTSPLLRLLHWMAQMDEGCLSSTICYSDQQELQGLD